MSPEPVRTGCRAFSYTNRHLSKHHGWSKMPFVPFYWKIDLIKKSGLQRSRTKHKSGKQDQKWWVRAELDAYAHQLCPWTPQHPSCWSWTCLSKAHVVPEDFHNICSKCRLKSSRGSFFPPWIQTHYFKWLFKLFGKEHQCGDMRSSERFALFPRHPGNSMRNPEFVHCSSKNNEHSSASTCHARDSRKSFNWVSSRHTV